MYVCTYLYYFCTAQKVVSLLLAPKWLINHWSHSKFVSNCSCICLLFSNLLLLKQKKISNGSKNWDNNLTEPISIILVKGSRILNVFAKSIKCYLCMLVCSTQKLGSKIDLSYGVIKISALYSALQHFLLISDASHQSISNTYIWSSLLIQDSPLADEELVQA